MKTIHTIIILILSLFIQYTTIAQDHSSTKYLQKVGITDSLYSETLNESRQIYIQYPAYYNPESDQKYPVAYILDGKVFLPTVNTVHQFYSGGFMPEMILVGIANDKNRMRDLTTSKVNEMYGQPFTEENGEAENFITFIESELIPYIENKYPVTSYRTLIGHSYGGLFTIQTLIHHPQLFANYLAIDPSLQWDNQKLLKEAKSKLSKQSYIGKSLFVSLSGQLHRQDSKITIDNVMKDNSDFTLFSRSNITFANFAREYNKNGLSFYWKFYPNDLHGTVPLPSIKDGLLSMFEWYQMENTDKINTFETPTKELYDIIKKRQAKLKSHFGYSEPPYPEDLLNMSGYMSMDMNQPEKAKMYFEFAIEYYPKSANAYDSMSEYYEKNGDKKKAIQFLEKAINLSGNEIYRNKMESLKDKEK